MPRQFSTITLALIGLMMISTVPWIGQTVSSQTNSNVFEVNKLLARTVNFGNALEAPIEGQWGLTLREEYFELIQKAGFTAVRVPIKFSAHAEMKAPYKIARDFWLRIDWVIQQAKKNKLAVILDLQNYDELLKDPANHLERWLGLWAQIANRYKNQPEGVIFEPLNEPNGKLEPYWNEYFAKGLVVVRQTNPTRAVIVGPNAWNNAERFPELKLPNDPNLILTFHNYTPFEFTHQGAEWWADGAKHLGTTWTGSDAEQKVVLDYIDKGSSYGRANNRPVFMGEFGAYKRADFDSRLRWTRFTRETAETNGLSWGYWEFGSGFGVYDSLNDHWREPLLEALVK
jgi:endoglucanase